MKLSSYRWFVKLLVTTGACSIILASTYGNIQAQENFAIDKSGSTKFSISIDDYYYIDKDIKSRVDLYEADKDYYSHIFAQRREEMTWFLDHDEIHNDVFPSDY